MTPTSGVNEEIPVLCGSGSGETTLSAFHAALAAVKLGNCNLIRLTSVIPPGVSIDATGKAVTPTGAWGDRLYCVYAEQRTAVVGEQAWAGIGWVQRLDGMGGWFVEHEGADEGLVAHAIRASLSDMVAGREADFAPADLVVNGVICTGDPVCSLVIAPFKSESWASAA